MTKILTYDNKDLAQEITIPDKLIQSLPSTVDTSDKVINISDMPRYVLNMSFMAEERWSEGEQFILRSGDLSVMLDYAKHVIHGRWPEAEYHIKNDGAAAYRYAMDRDCRFQQAEDAIQECELWMLYFYKFFIISNNRHNSNAKIPDPFAKMMEIANG